MPTVSLPGIGAKIFILSAFVALAISASSAVILFTLSPLLGYISYLVIVGPLVMSPAETLTLK